MPASITVLIADDHDIVRQGLRAAMRLDPEFSVVAEARNGQEAVDLALQFEPDLVVMDIRMPLMTGIEACREIRDHVKSRVLILTSYSDERAVVAAVMAGASGFLLKDADSAQLIGAMKAVAAGRSTLDPAATEAVLRQVRRSSVISEEDRMAQQLTERELSVLDLVAEGLTNREIGARLYLSEKTVKHHVSDILAKLGLARRIEAAGFAARRAANRLSGERLD